MWKFKKKRKKRRHVALGRVIFSSQPDPGSAPPDADPRDTRGSPLPRDSEPTGHGRLRHGGGPGSPKSTVSHLVRSHHKSSSLGSACLERVVLHRGGGGAPAAGKTHLERDDEQMCLMWRGGGMDLKEENPISVDMDYKSFLV